MYWITLNERGPIHTTTGTIDNDDDDEPCERVGVNLNIEMHRQIMTFKRHFDMQRDTFLFSNVYFSIFNCENIEINFQKIILNFHVQTLSNFTRRMPFDVPFDVLGLELSL